jgi:succinoglycan biosynthesis transport protein ExoP
VKVRDYLRVLAERRVIIILAVVLSLLAAGATYALRPAKYTASLSMYVSATGAEDTASLASGSELVLQRVKSYVVLASSRRVSQDVVEKLGLPLTPDALSERISASTPLDTAIIDISVWDESPQRAAVIVNAVAKDFTDVSGELTRNAQLGQSMVALQVVQPAVPPASPSSPGLGLTLAFGLLAGLIIGVGGALIVNSFDTSIRNVGTLRQVGAPVLGVIDDDARVPLVVGDDPSTSPRSDELRKLRTSLQFAGGGKPVGIVVMTSATPDHGLTTRTTIDLAETMAAASSRVLVIEGDLRTPRLGRILRLDESVGLSTVLSGDLPVGQAIQPARNKAFDVLTGGPVPANPSDLLAGRPMERLLRELRTAYDIVLIDSPPLLPYADAAVIAAATDGAVIVCRSRAVKQREVEEAAAELRSVFAPLLGTVLVTSHRTIRRRVRWERPGSGADPVPHPATTGAPAPATPTGVTSPAVSASPNGRNHVPIPSEPHEAGVGPQE